MRRYTVKKVSDFPIPSWDVSHVNNQTLPSLGTGKSVPFLQCKQLHTYQTPKTFIYSIYLRHF
jgi:hypothetical protein